MKRTLSLLLAVAFILLMSITVAREIHSSATQTLNKRWEKVEEFRKQDLPQSTLRELLAIQQEAIGQQGITDRVKATLAALETTLTIDQEKSDSLLTDLHSKIATATTTVEQTFLRFGLAEAQRRIARIKPSRPSSPATSVELTDKELADLSEVRTITYCSLIASDSALIEYYPTLDDYFVEKQIQQLERWITYGERKEIADTLLIAPQEHFLSYNIAHSKLSPTVRSLIKNYQYLSRKQQQPTHVALMRELERMREFSYYLIDHKEVYKRSLETLLSQYNASPYSVEIIAELCGQRLSDSDETQTVERLESYINRFPDYPRIGILKQRRNEILQGTYSVLTPRQAYPDTPFDILITFRKIKALNLTIRRISAADTLLCVEPYSSWELSNLFKKRKIEPDTTVTFAKQLSLPFSYQEDKTKVSLKLNNGLYRCDIKTTGEEQSSLYILVNPYNAVARSYNGMRDIQVWDFRSAQPLHNTTVEIWDNQPSNEQPERTATLRTDSYGRTDIPRSTIGKMYRIVGRNANQSKWGHMPFDFASNQPSDHKRIALYPDRGAYRPGQRLRFEGLAWNSFSERPAQGLNIEITLKDRNNKPVHQWNATANSFGSFVGELLLPNEIQSGYYYLQANQSTPTMISIEEYKRPTLSISINKTTLTNECLTNQDPEFLIEGTVLLNNGVGLSNARIHYSLNQSGYTPDTLTTTSDHSGRFIIRQKVKRREDGFPNWRIRPFPPTLTLTATDAKGESQTIRQTLAIRPRVSVQVDLPEVLLAGTPYQFPIKIERQFPASTEISGTYAIERNTQQEKWKSIQTGEWKENSTLAFNNKEKLATGRYRILFRSSCFGKDSLLGTSSTIIIQPKSKEMPFADRLWTYTPTDTIDTGSTFDLWIGSSEKARAMVELMNEHRFISRQYLPLNKNLNKLSFDYRPEWGKSVSVNVSAFVQGEYKSTQHLIVARQPDKTLHIEIKTLRNKMLPGEKETWTLSIKDSQGKPVAGEIMTTLYDSSLDKINPLYWNTDPFRQNQYLYTPNAAFNHYAHWNYHNGSTPLERIVTPQAPASYFRNLTGINIGGGGEYEENAFTLKQTLGYSTAYKSNDAIQIRGNSTPQAAPAQTDRAESTEEALPPVRRNFNESAFFFAQLRTNNKGEVKLPFTLPESLTSYSLRIFAHDRTLRSAYTESTIQVEKTIMINANVPRFVYEADSVRIKAIVFNLSDRKRSIRTSFALGTNNRPIGETILEAGEQKEIECSFVAPSDSSGVTLTLSASTDGFGDAERHLIPILPRSQQVKETQLFNFPKGGTFTIDKPFAQSSIGELDVTYIGSPIYHLLQALPNVPMPQSENMTAFLNAYYLNHAARLIGQRFAFEQKGKATPEQLLIIQTRLLAFQHPDGGFRWFECMPSSVEMTLFFLETTQRLGVNIGCDLPQEIKIAQINALKFVDEKLVQNYRNDTIHLSQKQNTEVPHFTLQYMSVRGQFRDIPLAGATLAAHRFYLDRLVKKRTTFSLAQKGLLASALFRYGQLAEAREVIRSLREYSVCSPDKGRYFANNRNPIYHNLRNINTQTQIMEAFALNKQLVKDEQQQTTNELSEMTTWLIYQKQGMDWGNEAATINALNAILTYGIDPKSISFKGRQWASINLPATHLTQEENTSQSYRFTADEWKKTENQISIKKKTTDYSRLMVTWERRSPLEQIKPSEGDITIRQELLGPTPLKIGAATIRLTLTAKRDLDYLVVRSPRGACMEPTSQNSNYESTDQFRYYKEVKDQGTNLYIEHLPRGTHTVDLPIWINLNGVYQQGVPTIQSLFAPEFNGVGQATQYTIHN